MNDDTISHIMPVESLKFSLISSFTLFNHHWHNPTSCPFTLFSYLSMSFASTMPFSYLLCQPQSDLTVLPWKCLFSYSILPWHLSLGLSQSSPCQFPVSWISTTSFLTLVAKASYLNTNMLWPSLIKQLQLFPINCLPRAGSNSCFHFTIFYSQLIMFSKLSPQLHWWDTLKAFMLKYLCLCCYLSLQCPPLLPNVTTDYADLTWHFRCICSGWLRDLNTYHLLDTVPDSFSCPMTLNAQNNPTQ
jgi:hypothetical protein